MAAALQTLSDFAGAVVGSGGGGGGEEAVYFANFLLREHGEKVGIFGLHAREGFGGGDDAAEGVEIGFIGGGAGGAAVEDSADGDDEILLGDVLVDGVIGEAGESGGDDVDFDFGFVGVGEGDDLLGEAAELGGAEGVVGGGAGGFSSGGWRAARRLAARFGSGFGRWRHFYLAKATPILTLRKRAGAAPCPVPMVCIGWPLPQLGVPQRVQ